MTGTVTIQRYHPERDAAPYDQTFSFEYEQYMTVLDVLHQVARGQDPTLRYQYCCRSGHCGICGILVNGTPVMSCRAAATREMRIAPLAGFPIQRDLVVDRAQADGLRSRLRLYLEREQEPDSPLEAIDMDQFEAMRPATRCVECLCCLSACPVWRKNPYEFAGPTAFVLEARHFFDSRDTQKRGLIARTAGIDRCIRCGKCSKVCPQQAGPMEAIERIQSTLA